MDRQQFAGTFKIKDPEQGNKILYCFFKTSSLQVMKNMLSQVRRKVK